MTSPPDQPSPFPLGDALNDVPLFRELQRVLLSSTGPVNWELARQVGVATGAWGQDDPAPGEEDRQSLSDTVRAAELAVVEHTGLPTPTQVTEIGVIRRSEWVERSIRDLRELVEPVAARVSGALGQTLSGSEAEGIPGPAISGQDAQGLAMLMDRMAPLLMGVQVGSVFGSLAQQVLGQYDLAVPRPGGTVAFVLPNIIRFEQEWSLPPVEFRAWMALHEVTHRLEYARPWAREHFLALVKDLVDHAELDLAGLARQLEGLDVANPEALGEAVESMGNLFGEASDSEQRLRIARVQAFLAAAEGYGDHVTEILGRRMLTAFDQIAEALRRHREGRHADQALERLLGLETTTEAYERARVFCRRVAEDAGEAVLARMWESPEALPSTPELQEPTLWLARTA